MKASLKFREDQKPLFRAKVPLNILGFPFQSGIVAGESKELSLNLATFFDSGPSFKIAYRPNDSLNPFSLLFKTGIGHFGSPISSAMNMSAEFNLIGGQNPSFFVNFKPQFGDFTIKKTQSSVFKKSQSKVVGSSAVSDEDGSVMVEAPVINSGYLQETGKKFAVLPLESPAAGVVKGALSDVEMSARTGVPLRKHAVLNFRWGIKFPTEETAVQKKLNPTSFHFPKLPLLVMNKIGIEHISRDDSKDSNEVGPRQGSDVAEACLDIKRQLEVIQAENGIIRKAMDDLKSEFSSVNLVKYGDGERKSAGGKMDRSTIGNKKSSGVNGFGGKAMEGELSEELQKGLKGSNDV